MLSNLYPTIPGGKLAVITECPSKDDVLSGRPFDSNTGKFLKSLLGQVGIVPQKCLMGYVYGDTAPMGNLQYLSKSKTDELNESISRLYYDLRMFQPNCVLALGQRTLTVMGGRHNLDDFRGSIFESNVLGDHITKVVSSYTPLHCFQKPIDSHLLKFDAHRAFKESLTHELVLPERTIDIAEDIGTALNFLTQIHSEHRLLGFDVEGYPDGKGVTCLSLSPTPTYSMVIPFRRMTGGNVFTVEEEVLIWRKLAEILSDPKVEKICQNGMYELFIMAWKHKIVIANLREDTMIKHWELYPEFDKNLGFQTSLYTREPFFKDGRDADTDQGHWVYNGKDSCILHDINNTQDPLIKRVPGSVQSYRFKMELLKPYTYMAMRGCLIDQKRLLQHRHELLEKIIKLQNTLNALVGKPINVKSVKDKPWLLYDHLGLPKQYAGRGTTRKLTSNEEAILRCRQLNRDSHTDLILSTTLDLIKARTDFSDTYKLEPFEDGRIRSSYNPVGTDTGRLSSSSTSVRAIITKAKIKLAPNGNTVVKNETKQDFLGTNLQNVSKWLRDVFVPDPGYRFWQFDYSGADAWTVAADCAALGNPKMLEHLQQGVKPSCVILMMRKYGSEVILWDVDKILEVQPEMINAGKMYVCAKACQHGTNYGMGAQLLADTIFKRSRGDILITSTQAKQLQTAYESYYTVSKRTNYIRNQLSKYGYLDTVSGTRRRFLNIRNSYNVEASVLRAALSFEPQNNTTYATNLALHRLYYWSANRDAVGNLVHQPLLMIHDALAGQSPVDIDDTILRRAFDVEMTVHGITFTIPAEGGFGPNWKET